MPRTGTLIFVVFALAGVGSLLWCCLGGVSPVERDARAVCGKPGEEEEAKHLQWYGLPEVISVNWGQWHGPYAHPPERLVLCHSGQGFLWQKAGGALSNFGRYLWNTEAVALRKLDPDESANLFALLLKAWPQGLTARGADDGNFIWLLDEDQNLIVAPMTQMRTPGYGLEEVKHGDLCPGITFFGHNGAAGPYRGVARLGGEFNLAGTRDGTEWLMHAKSGYTAYRVPLYKASDYYHFMRAAGRNESDIARQFQRCVFREIFRTRTPLTRVFCYMQHRFSVQASLGDTQQCDIRNKVSSGLPNLAECIQKPSGDAPMCGQSQKTCSATVIHLVDWYAPGQDRCNLNVKQFNSMMEGISAKIKRLAESYTPQGGVRELAKELRGLRKHACLFSIEFTEQLHCNVHGCLGEGFTQQLKAAENALQNGGETQEHWAKAMKTWSQCRSMA